MRPVRPWMRPVGGPAGYVSCWPDPDPGSTWALEETFDGDPSAPSQDLLPRNFDYVAVHDPGDDPQYAGLDWVTWYVYFDMVDGLQNILPANAPRFAQTNTSNLVDAYKWAELDPDTGLAMFTLYSGITDRAEPCESLRANVVYSLGLDNPTILVSSEQLNAFRQGSGVNQETHRRGVRGAP